jgi:alpha-beta hydrolase superfamily lysophospholipase
VRQVEGNVAVGVSERWFTGAGGARLFERAWLPHGAAKARIVLVHGYAEHAGRYEYVGETLASAGYEVHAFDLRGHGRSEGDRALVRSFDAYLDDLGIFLSRVTADATPMPTFLLGHSMGGAIVALHAIERTPDIRGLVLSGPAITDRSGIAAWVMSTVGRIVPRLPLVKLDAAAVSRDPDVVRRYDGDPLVYRGRVKAGLLTAMLDAGRRVVRGAPSLDAPLLIVHGREDRLAPVAVSEALFGAMTSSDKILKMYDGLFHEVFNEPERDDVLADVIRWLDARV